MAIIELRGPGSGLRLMFGCLRFANTSRVQTVFVWPTAILIFQQ